MRVLVVHNRYRSTAPSGEDRVVDQETEALRARGHMVGQFERFNDDIDTWPLARRALIGAQVAWGGGGRRALGRALRRFRPDVVHIHNTFPLLGASVLSACRDARTPAVVTLHNYRLLCASGDLFRDGRVCHDCLGRAPIPAVRHGCYRDSALATLPLTAATMLRARTWRTLPSAFVFVSSAERDLFAELDLPSERTFVKPNLIVAMPAPVGLREAKVVFAGRLSESKGVPLLMDAWDRYLAGAPPDALRLQIVGSGELDVDVARWAATRGSVDVLGLTSRAECAAVVGRARALVAPSQWEETFGLVVVEAMALGVPSIASAHGSFPELISDGADGVLFEPGNSLQLARVLCDVETDPGRFEHLGRCARATYECRFDPETNIEQLLEIYDFARSNPAGS